MILKVTYVIKTVLLMTIVLLIMIDTSACAACAYYSIHLFSFKNLEDANKHVNSLRNQGKAVFWEKVKIQGVGEYYRVYMGRYKSWDDAIKFRNKIKEIGTGSPLGIQCFLETFTADNKQTAAKTLLPKKSAAIHQISSVFEKDRFVDNKDGTLTDRKTNLMWLKNGWRLDFVSAVTWWDAVKKVASINVGGYDDWRLPTIEEWSSLLDTGNQNPALIDPNPFVNIISHMPYWSQTEFIYSKAHTCNKQCPLDTYTVMLYSGKIQHQKKSERAFIMPVRSVGLSDNFVSRTAK